MSEIRENRSEAMSTATLKEASDLLRELAGRREADESIKAVLRRVSRKLADWNPSRVRDVWYRDPRVKIRATEVEHLRALVKRKAQKADVDELVEIRTRVARIERLLEAADPAFAGPTIAAARHQLGQVRGEPGLARRSDDRGRR